MSPTHAATPCVEQGCFELATAKGRCARCQLLRGGGRTEYDQRRGSPRERGYNRKWERRRRWHLEAEPFCRICGKPGNEVDHVIPHRGAEWLFDLKGNLQTLCKGHHSKKTQRERTIPIGMMYPLDLPTPPHYRPTELHCGPMFEEYSDLERRNRGLALALNLRTSTPLVWEIPAPRTAERAFWSYVLEAPAELQEPPLEWVVDGHPEAWWADYMLDGRAEEAMARRLG